MNRIKTFSVLLCALLLSACGLMELETEEIIATEMHLERDTLYIMVGDQLILQPVFTPESEATKDVLWTSSASNVLSIKDNVFTGVGEGWAKVCVENVAKQLKDSCYVNVMRKWEDVSREYPYEMMVYADVKVNGKAFDPETMMIAAFVDDEMRGAGQFMQSKNVSYVRFRVGSNLSKYNPEGFYETVSFRVYYKKDLLYDEFPQTIDFDAEAHGSLSSLFELKL